MMGSGSFSTDDPDSDDGAGQRARAAVLAKLDRLRPQTMTVILRTAAEAATRGRLKAVRTDHAVGRAAQAALRAVESMRDSREIVADGQRGERMVYTTAAKAASPRRPPFGR